MRVFPSERRKFGVSPSLGCDSRPTGPARHIPASGFLRPSPMTQSQMAVPMPTLERGKPTGFSRGWLTDEAYAAFRRERRKDESFTEAILRLARSRGRLSERFGAWDVSDEEAAMIADELSRGWHAAQEKVEREIPRQ